MKNKYKAVFLDWHKTLSNHNFWHQLENTHHPRHKNLDLITSELFQGSLSDMLDPWMRGKYKTEEIIQLVSEKINLDFIEVLNDLIDSCKSMQFISPEIPKIVKNLQKLGMKVYIATDNMDTFTRWTMPALNITNIFDGVLNSYDLKARKKDFDDNKSLFFGDLILKNNINKGEAIMFDDAEDKENKLKNFGVDYVQIGPGELIDELNRFLD